MKAEAILQYMNPEYIVRVSATTKTNKEAEFIKIDELEVINAGLITRALIYNDLVISHAFITSNSSIFINSSS